MVSLKLNSHQALIDFAVGQQAIVFIVTAEEAGSYFNGSE